MSLGENSLVAAYQGKGQLKSRPSGTRVVTHVLFYCCVPCDIASINNIIANKCGPLARLLARRCSARRNITNHTDKLKLREQQVALQLYLKGTRGVSLDEILWKTIP